jgi:hypothetical protein
LSGTGAEPADYTYSYAADYQHLASCGYDKIEDFWHNGPTRHAADIAKADLPSRGEIRISESTPLSGSRVAGWEIRFAKDGERKSRVAVRRAVNGIFGGADAFYEVDIPRILASCARGI